MSSSSSARKRFLVRNPVVVDVGCSCRRRRRPSKLFSLLSSISRSLKSSYNKGGKFTPVAKHYTSSPAFSYTKKKRGVVNERSVAVVKESTEPYVDFRESMVQMIVEEELYSWDDLDELLHRFLSLNSPEHHHLILGAFADIWDAVFSPQQ